ncbi:mucin-2-like [Macrobrachium nipponense]|uniref:mucin-2-like n=1 Tax=Macrobrachium nipponense TaxID=159736 RepID=UPI0030C8A80C
MLKDRKLNIAPAIKKQVSDVGYMKTYSPRLVDSNSSMVGAGGTVFFGNGATYTTYGNSVPVIGPAEYHPQFTQAPAVAAAPPPAPSAYQTIVYQQPMYYATQQFQYQPTQTMQAQWGAAPQWRWVTPASYPQPECSSQCLVEPSSLAQRDHTTTAVGSTPNVSTHHVLATPSTSLSSNATTTTTTTMSTSLSITPSASTSTSSLSDVNMTVCNSLLLIKPLTVNGRPALANGKTKSLSSLVSNAVDTNNNLPEVNKEAVCSTPHVSHTATSDLDVSSDSASKMSSSATTVNTIDSSSTNHNAKEESDCIADNVPQVFQNFAIRTSREAFNDCDTLLPVHPEVKPSIENYSSEVPDSEHVYQDSSNTSSLPPGLPYGVFPSARHVSSCPHYTGEVVSGPRSLVPQHVSSPVIMIPSLASLNKPVNSSPLYDLTSKSNTYKTNHAVRSQVSPSPPAAQPQIVSFSTVPISPLTASLEIAKTMPTCVVITSTKDTMACNADAMSSTSVTTCITTTTATSISTTSTVLSNTQSLCSPVNHDSHYSYRPSSVFTPPPVNSVSQSSYRYANQSMWMIVPSYHVWRAGMPCYQLPAPLPTQWPVPPPPSFYATSCMNYTSPTYSGTTSVSSMFTEPVCSGLTLLNNFPARDQTSSEETGLGFVHSKQCEKNYQSSLGENSGADSRVLLHIPPLASSPRVKYGEHSMQKKSKGSRNSKPSHLNRSSPCKAIPPPSKNLRPSKISCQPASRSFNPAAEENDPRPPRDFEDSCGLMPITPPPTPVLKSDSSAIIVSDTNVC